MRVGLEAPADIFQDTFERWEVLQGGEYQDRSGMPAHRQAPANRACGNTAPGEALHGRPSQSEHALCHAHAAATRHGPAITDSSHARRSRGVSADEQTAATHGKSADWIALTSSSSVPASQRTLPPQSSVPRPRPDVGRAGEMTA
jgi:hypothetical protein